MKNKIAPVLCFSVLAIINSSQAQNADSILSVTVGRQVWTAKNLDVGTFVNGDTIKEAKTDKEWRKAGKNKIPAWCYLNHDLKLGSRYGKLYNWYAVTDPRGLAPKGWHIPNKNEWMELIDFLGGNAVAGGKMKSDSGWQTSGMIYEVFQMNGNGTNESSLKFLPNEYIDEGAYISPHMDRDQVGLWWSTTQNTTTTFGTESVWVVILKNSIPGVYPSMSAYFGYGLAVRCIKDR